MSNFLNVISPDTGEVILSSQKFYENNLRDRGFTPADGWNKEFPVKTGDAIYDYMLRTAEDNKNENETGQSTEAEKDAEVKNGAQTKNEAQRQKNSVRDKAIGVTGQGSGVMGKS